MTFGEKIATVRKAEGLTQEELADSHHAFMELFLKEWEQEIV